MTTIQDASKALLAPFFLLLVVFTTSTSAVDCCPATDYYPARCTCKEATFLSTISGLDFNCSSASDGFTMMKFLQRIPEACKGIKLTTPSNSFIAKLTSRFTDYIDITLNSNIITSISVDFFKNSINTVRISLSSNRLTSFPFPSGVLNFPLATDISISLVKNSISSIPPGFFQAPKATKVSLDLSNTRLTRLDENVFKPVLKRFAEIGDAAKLILSKAPIDCTTDTCHLAWLIEEGTGLLNYVSGATCSNGTALRNLDPFDLVATTASFTNYISCPQTNYYDQCTCQVASNFLGLVFRCPSSAFDDSKIRHLLKRLCVKGIQLTSEGSSLTKFPAHVSRFTDYVDINLKNGMITSIPVGTFNNSKNSVQIYLNGNQLTSLPPGVFNFPLATADIKIFLNGNPISSISPGFFQAPKARNVFLDLSDTKLARFDEDVFKPVLERFAHAFAYQFGYGKVALLKTPIDCTTDKCHLAWLIRDRPELLKHVGGATCSNGTPFEKLDTNDFAKPKCP